MNIQLVIYIFFIIRKWRNEIEKLGGSGLGRTSSLESYKNKHLDPDRSVRTGSGRKMEQEYDVRIR